MITKKKPVEFDKYERIDYVLSTIGLAGIHVAWLAICLMLGVVGLFAAAFVRQYDNPQLLYFVFLLPQFVAMSMYVLVCEYIAKEQEKLKEKYGKGGERGASRK